MSNRRRPKHPTTSELDDILAEIQALPESSVDEVAMELSDVTHHLRRLDASELTRDEGIDACRYGLKELDKEVADLMAAYCDLAESLGRALPATGGSVTA